MTNRPASRPVSTAGMEIMLALLWCGALVAYFWYGEEVSHAFFWEERLLIVAGALSLGFAVTPVALEGFTRQTRWRGRAAALCTLLGVIGVAVFFWGRSTLGRAYWTESNGSFAVNKHLIYHPWDLSALAPRMSAELVEVLSTKDRRQRHHDLLTVFSSAPASYVDLHPLDIAELLALVVEQTCQEVSSARCAELRCLATQHRWHSDQVLDATSPEGICSVKEHARILENAFIVRCSNDNIRRDFLSSIHDYHQHGAGSEARRFKVVKRAFERLCERDHNCCKATIRAYTPAAGYVLGDPMGQLLQSLRE